MKFVVLLSLALCAGCAYVPYIVEETLEVIEEVAEIEEHIVYKWWEDNTEDGENLKRILKDFFGDDPYPYALRIRPKKWPWGIC